MEPAVEGHHQPVNVKKRQDVKENVLVRPLPDFLWRACIFVTRFRWVIIAPFDFPVVPEV